MSEQKQPRGLRSIGVFVTADALLAAIVLFWGQLWAKHPEHPVYPYALAWTHLTVVLALAALAIAGWQTLRTRSDKVPYVAVGLFAAALEMGILNVLQSLFTNTLGALDKLVNHEHFDISRTFLILTGVVIFILVATCIGGVQSLYRTDGRGYWKSHWLWALNQLSVTFLGGWVLYHGYQDAIGTCCVWLLIGILLVAFLCIHVLLSRHVKTKRKHPLPEADQSS